MTPKRRALGALTKADLLEIGRHFELEVVARMSLDELLDAVGRSKKATLDKIVRVVSRDTLKAMCDALEIPRDGRDKQVIIDRIVAATGGEAANASEPEGEASTGVVAGGTKPVASSKGSKKATAAPAKAQAWLGFPTLEGTPTPEAPEPTKPALRSLAGEDWTVSLEVEARKPRLAWQGMWRKEIAVAVPTQVVEIVHPGRAVRRGDELAFEARQASGRDRTMVPPNRLIWTNDNLVALQTLLDERDPETRDYRYRGKVDLIYIDPPFMVNNDFRADSRSSAARSAGAAARSAYPLHEPQPSGPTPEASPQIFPRIDCISRCS